MDFFVLRKVGGSLLALFYADFNSTVFSQSREYNFENEKKLSHFQDGKFKVLSHHGFSKNHIISSVCLKQNQRWW